MLGKAVLMLGLLAVAGGAMAQNEEGPAERRGTLEHGWIEESHSDRRGGTLEHGWIEKTRNDPPGRHIMDGFGNPPRRDDYPPGPRW